MSEGAKAAVTIGNESHPAGAGTAAPNPAGLSRFGTAPWQGEAKAANDEEVKRLQGELDGMRTRSTELEAQLASASQEAATLRKKLGNTVNAALVLRRRRDEKTKVRSRWACTLCFFNVSTTNL